uniref:Uncharacterized protein n=1 Tax=Sphaerodactylus townsendi TaxID=933632 RepID=A0ACB8EGQ5_9SAUR
MCLLLSLWNLLAELISQLEEKEEVFLGIFDEEEELPGEVCDPAYEMKEHCVNEKGDTYSDGKDSTEYLRALKNKDGKEPIKERCNSGPFQEGDLHKAAAVNKINEKYERNLH